MMELLYCITMKILSAALFLSSAFSVCAAEPPRVITDIAPVHSLVAMVMGERGAPVLLLPAGRSPHGYALKPSQARALQSADVVVRVGGTLTPWLASALGSLGRGVADVELLETAGTTRLAYREGVALGDSDHAHDHGADHDAHREEHDQHAGDADVDPHAWLDPSNAAHWLGAIATALAAADPDGAVMYRRNAAESRERIEQLTREIAAAVEPFYDVTFLVYHDAFHYYEARFGIEAAGSVARGDGAAPGARRLREVRSLARSDSATCLFTEPQIPDRAASTVAEGSSLRRATLDPLGAGLSPGPNLYPALMRRLTESFVAWRGKAG